MSIDMGTLNYFMRMVVTNGFTNTSLDYLEQLANDQYTAGYEAGTSDALAAAATEATVLSATPVAADPTPAADEAPSAPVKASK